MAAGSTGRYSAQTAAWYKRHTSPAASPSIHKTGRQENRMKNIVVITGASSGFGFLASHALARAGHTVYAGMRETRGRNAPQVEEANRRPISGGSITGFAANRVRPVSAKPPGRKGERAFYPVTTSSCS